MGGREISLGASPGSVWSNRSGITTAAVAMTRIADTGRRQVVAAERNQPRQLRRGRRHGRLMRPATACRHDGDVLRFGDTAIKCAVSGSGPWSRTSRALATGSDPGHRCRPRNARVHSPSIRSAHRQAGGVRPGENGKPGTSRSGTRTPETRPLLVTTVPMGGRRRDRSQRRHHLP